MFIFCSDQQLYYQSTTFMQFLSVDGVDLKGVLILVMFLTEKQVMMQTKNRLQI